MPRVTRAALRSKEIQEESDLAASTPLPSTPIKPRAPLGEISNNKVTEPGPVNATEEKVEPSKKGKGKKAHGTKKMTKQKKDNKEQPDGEVLEDGNESTTSSALEEACRDLLRGKSGTFPRFLADRFSLH